MPGNYSKLVTVVTGQTITASERNNEHDNHINNATPDGVDDASASLAAMQTTRDPYPGAVASQPTNLAGELQGLRYQLTQLTGEAQWYIDPDTSINGTVGALDDAASPASTAASLKARLDHIVSEIKRITGNANWYDAVAVNLLNKLSLAGGTMAGNIALGGNKITGSGAATANGDLVRYEQLIQLCKYRRPVLQFGSTTTVAVEAGTDGTSTNIPILFPDGDLRTMTSSATTTTFNITRNAVLTDSGLQTGLRASLSEATNTWYALYAVKCTDNAAKWTTVGDTVLPLSTNFATLNTNFGTNGWVYLGLIRNGDNSGATGDILSFAMAGNMTLFNNVCAGGKGINLTGLLLATTASATTLTYTYAAGTGTSNIPDNITLANYEGDRGNVNASWSMSNSANTISRFGLNSPGIGGITVWSPASDGVLLAMGTTTSATIALYGFVDGKLGVGANPLM